MLFPNVEVHYVCRHRRRVTIKTAPCPAEGSNGRCEQVASTQILRRWLEAAGWG